jgi:hypothetical protein
MLAESAAKDELRDGHAETLAEWAAGAGRPDLEAWRLDDLWAAVLGRGHTITVPTQRFVTGWVREVAAGPSDLVQNETARRLIRDRERRLKGARSRFTNRRALDQWGGSSGISPLNFRWQITRQLLSDLHSGLRPE